MSARIRGLVACRRKRRLGAPRRARGFTLLEVLLATTLLAAGLAIAFATLRTAAATTQRGEALSERNERIRAVSSFLRGRIGGTQGLVFELDETTGESKRFEGSARSMRFVADLPDYLGRGGPHLHALSATGGDDGGDLTIAFHMVQGGEALPALRPPEPLATDIRALAFSYRRLDENARLGDWESTWSETEALPVQVRVQITDARGAWPDMVVSLPLAGAYTREGRP